MEVLQHILHGFAVATQPINIAYLFAGCLLGTVIGVLPGVGPAAGIALLVLGIMVLVLSDEASRDFFRELE